MKTKTLLLAVLLASTAITGAAPAPYGWGMNANGQIGDSTTTARSSPAATDVSGVLAGKTITALSMSATAAHALALTSDGKVYAWGENVEGQLGNSSATSYFTSPVAVDMTGVLSGKTVVAVAAGFQHSLALTSDGGLYAWGSNFKGELGNNSTADSTVPVAVDMTGVLAGKTIVQLAAGWNVSAVLDSTGTVYTWGDNASGTLGDGSSNTESRVAVAVDTTGVLSGKAVSRLRAGGYQMLVQTTDGMLFGWGKNNRGQVGDGTSMTNRRSPVALDVSGVLASKTIIDIAAGNEHGLALASDGTVYGWGADDFYQLGNAAVTLQSHSAIAVDASGVLFGKTVTAIAAGFTNSYVLTSDGDLIGWGSNSGGAVGDGTTTNRDTPVAVDMSGALASSAVSSIHAGFLTGLVLAAPATSTITPACRFSYAANFGWQNWRWSAASPAAPAIESAILHGSVYSANIGWIDLGDGTPTSGIRYSQSGQDFGVNHDGAGALAGYAYAANIGWIRFAQTWNSPPRVNLTTGALSGYAYSANCGWIHLGSLKTRISSGPDTEVLAGGGTGDGIADSWELERLAAAGLGGNLSLLGTSPTSDYDHDGISDHDEYLADTNPFSASNRLNVTGLTYNPQTGHIDLNWTGSDRRAFSVYSSSDLMSWTQVGTAQTGSTAALTLGGASVTKLFFRVGAALPLTP